MNNKKIEDYITNSFNMTMQDFMRQMVEVKGLVDKEIAEILNVSIRFVWNIRNEYGLKKARASLRRFEKRYGSNAIAKFKIIIENLMVIPVHPNPAGTCGTFTKKEIS